MDLEKCPKSRILIVFLRVFGIKDFDGVLTTLDVEDGSTRRPVCMNEEAKEGRTCLDIC
jgi:hypothetical protein